MTTEAETAATAVVSNRTRISFMKEEASVRRRTLLQGSSGVGRVLSGSTTAIHHRAVVERPDSLLELRVGGKNQVTIY